MNLEQQQNTLVGIQMKKSSWIRRPLGWLLFFAISLLLFRIPVLAQPAMTQINDILYRADGSVANGSLIISWPAFITSDRQPVVAGSKVVAIGPGGLVSTSLVPTASATPVGTTYKIVAKMTDGTTFTEYWSVPATAGATIASMRVSPSMVSPSAALDATIAKKLDRSGDTPVTLADLRFASQYPGGDAGKQIGSAASNCPSGPCVVVAPSTMGSGGPSSLPDNVALMDFRGINSPNAFGHETSMYGYGLLLRRQFVTNPGLSTTKGALGAYCAALAGGINRGSDEPGGWFKANYLCAGIGGTWRTPGQHSVLGASANGFSLGDHFGVTTILTDWGGPSAGGDESTQGFAARLYEGEAIFSATVASVAGADTVNFSSAVNADTLGEGRYLVNTTPGKTHSAGTVASISGKTFTFTGAGIQAKFGDGAKGNLCLALDGNTMNIGSTPHKLVNLITSTSGETATIEWRYPGNSYPPRLATSGTYTIYACSPVTYVGVSYQPGVSSGTIKVADASVFAPNDTIQLPVWYQHTKGGVSATMSATGYNGGALFGGAWNGPGWLRNGINVIGGNIERGLEFTGGSIGEYGILFNRTIGNNVSMIADTPAAGVNNYVRRFLSTYTGQGNQTSLGFQMDPSTGGYWYMGRTQTNFSAGENGVGIGIAPQNNQKLAIVTTATSQLGLAVWNSGTVKASIDGVGTATVAKVCYTSTVCDWAGAGAPNGSCATGSTYRRTDGGPGSTFYVCEAGAWAAK